MTVGIAYRVPGQGAVLLCDSRVSGDDGHIFTDSDEKWIVGPGYAAICAGSLGGLWFDIRLSPPKNSAEFRWALTAENPAQTPPYEVLMYDWRQDTLWHLDHSGDATNTGSYSTIGCGGALALGALDTLNPVRSLAATDRTLRKVAQSVYRRNSFCGGRTRTLTITSGRKGSATVR